MKLKDIESRIARLRAKLEELKPTEELTDFQNIAQERSVLKEELELLGEAEEAERSRLRVEAKAQKLKARKEMLQFVVAKTERMIEEHDESTKRLKGLMADIAKELVHREKLCTRESVGFDLAEMYDLLTDAEVRGLLDSQEYVVFNVDVNQFGTEWRRAIQAACGECDTVPDRELLDRLERLTVEPMHLPNGHSYEGFYGASSSLISLATRLAAKDPATTPEQIAEAAVSEERVGLHQVIDIRSLHNPSD